MTIPTRQPACATLVASVLPDAPIIMFLVISHRPQGDGNQQILTQIKPDGIFTSDDLTAILIMKVAQELNIQIPEDLKSSAMMALLCRELLPTSGNDQAAAERYCLSLCRPTPQKIAGQEVQTTDYSCQSASYLARVFNTDIASKDDLHYWKSSLFSHSLKNFSQGINQIITVSF